MKANRWLVLVGMALSLYVAGCKGEAGPGDEVDAGTEQDSGTPDTDAGADAGLPDAGGDGPCLEVGTACSRTSGGAACCTGVCSEAGVCPEPSGQCTPA